MRRGFLGTVSAFCYSIAEGEADGTRPGAPGWVPPNAVTGFVLAQYARMPDYLRLPLFILTLVFDLAGVCRRGTLFHRMTPAARRQHIAAWRDSRFRIARDYVRLLESLAVFCWYSHAVALREEEQQVFAALGLPARAAFVDDVPVAGRAAGVAVETYRPAYHQAWSG